MELKPRLRRSSFVSTPAFRTDRHYNYLELLEMDCDKYGPASKKCGHAKSMKRSNEQILKSAGSHGGEISELLFPVDVLPPSNDVLTTSGPEEDDDAVGFALWDVCIVVSPATLGALLVPPPLITPSTGPVGIGIAGLNRYVDFPSTITLSPENWIPEPSEVTYSDPVISVKSSFVRMNFLPSLSLTTTTCSVPMLIGISDPCEIKSPGIGMIFVPMTSPFDVRETDSPLIFAAGSPNAMVFDPNITAGTGRDPRTAGMKMGCRFCDPIQMPSAFSTCIAAIESPDPCCRSLPPEDGICPRVPPTSGPPSLIGCSSIARGAPDG
jgi:hypothetical protein